MDLHAGSLGGLLIRFASVMALLSSAGSLFAEEFRSQTPQIRDGGGAIVEDGVLRIMDLVARQERGGDVVLEAEDAHFRKFQEDGWGGCTGTIERGVTEGRAGGSHTSRSSRKTGRGGVPGP